MSTTTIAETPHSKLVSRAHRIEEWAEKHLVDPRGIIYTYLDVATGKPPTDDFFTSDQAPLCAPICTPSEWHSYENTGQATSEYMLGLLYQYTVEKDPAVLTRIQRSYQALKYVYNSGSTVEEGFLPKMYGNRISVETSTDQVLYVMLAFDYYHQYASSSEKVDIDRMIVGLTRFWTNRNYRYRYFWMEDMEWPISRFPCLLLMAYRHSGDEAFKAEYDRLLEMKVNERPFESQLQPKLRGECPPTPYEKAHHAWLIGEVDGAVGMEVAQYDYLLSNDPGHPLAESWKKAMKIIWDDGTLVVAPDGTGYVHVLVDMDTLKPRRPEPEFHAEANPNPKNSMEAWIGWRHVTGGRTCDVTFIARSGVQVYKHIRDPEIIKVSQKILKAIDVENMISYMDPERYLPELRHRNNLLSGDGTAHWLWAYWLGRSEGVIS